MVWNDRYTNWLQGAAVGAVMTMAVGFGYFGWITQGAAKVSAETAVLTALVPICADTILADPAAAAALQTKRPGDYDDVVRDHLKVLAGRDNLGYQFNRDCGAELAKRAAKAAAK